MYFLEKEFKFEAAHQLMLHDGKCARLHGHSWVGRLIVTGQELLTALDNPAKQNMLIDYSDLKAVISPIVDEYLDHHFLNETLGCSMPTSEFIARWVFDKCFSKLAAPNILYGVQIDETCTSRCIYIPEPTRTTLFARRGSFPQAE